MQTAAATIPPSTQEQAAQPHLLEQRVQRRLETAGSEGTVTSSAPPVMPTPCHIHSSLHYILTLCTPVYT